MRLAHDISFGFVFAFVGLIHAPVRAADAAIVVALQSGRKFAGEIDPASNADELVLKTATADITVRRPIQWERIVEATVDGKRVDIAKLRHETEEKRGTGN